uniref:Alpha-E domain-containing protein n=1 Tax=Roseihalotalea indica TaxID=2867963 RepID=A0AA49GQX6_9BACT|nr:alpha-E domain-containing protein [Tunicatimonas sp. TK19036]
MMLSRTANSLFWIGRYCERIGHLARYISAQYLSSSDMPTSLDKKVVLESLLFTTRASNAFHEHGASLSDNEVIAFLTIDENYPYSIKNYISMMRENARGVRNNISTDVWEATNRFYHTTNGFSQQEMAKKGPYDFCKHCIDNTSIIKGVVDNTLLRNYAWSLIYTGIHLERSMQIVQILLAKLEDIRRGPDSDADPAINSYHWATLLRSAGGLDMSRHYYGTHPTRELVTDFFILNRKFPKSILYNLEKLRHHLKIISNGQPMTPDSVEFKVGKLASHIQYLTVNEILEQGETFLEDLEKELYTVGANLERQYFIS